jgi:hypothetical protein
LRAPGRLRGAAGGRPEPRCHIQIRTSLRSGSSSIFLFFFAAVLRIVRARSTGSTVLRTAAQRTVCDRRCAYFLTRTLRALLRWRTCAAGGGRGNRDGTACAGSHGNNDDGGRGSHCTDAVQAKLRCGWLGPHGFPSHGSCLKNSPGAHRSRQRNPSVGPIPWSTYWLNRPGGKFCGFLHSQARFYVRCTSGRYSFFRHA